MHAVAVVASVKVRIYQRLPILKTFPKPPCRASWFSRADCRGQCESSWPLQTEPTFAGNKPFCSQAKLTVIKHAVSRLTNVTTTLWLSISVLSVSVLVSIPRTAVFALGGLPGCTPYLWSLDSQHWHMAKHKVMDWKSEEACEIAIWCKRETWIPSNAFKAQMVYSNLILELHVEFLHIQRLTAEGALPWSHSEV